MDPDELKIDKVRGGSKISKAWEAWHVEPDEIVVIKKVSKGELRLPSGVIHVKIISLQSIENNADALKKIDKYINEGRLGGVSHDHNQRTFHFREDVARDLGDKRTFVITKSHGKEASEEVDATVQKIDDAEYDIVKKAVASLLATLTAMQISQSSATNNKQKTSKIGRTTAKPRVAPHTPEPISQVVKKSSQKDLKRDLDRKQARHAAEQILRQERSEKKAKMQRTKEEKRHAKEDREWDIKKETHKVENIKAEIRDELREDEE